MAYRLPTFNLMCAVWRFGNATTNPPDAFTTGNLCFGRRGYPGDSNLLPADPTKMPCGYLLLPKGADVIGDVDSSGSPDTVEIPVGSGAFWTVHWVHPIALGFDNEHARAIVLPLIGTTPPPTGDHIITETTFIIATEGGDEFIVE